MKTNSSSLITFIIFIILYGCTSTDEQSKNQNDFPVLKGPYLGQQTPGSTPEIFAPGIVSTGFDELFGCFTPDGKEFYYIQAGAPNWTIMVMKEKNGIWSKPEVASFSGRYIEKFALSPDGDKVILTSYMPKTEHGKSADTITVWISERTKDGWSNPTYIEGLDRAFAPSIASNGNLYFFLTKEEHQDIYMSKYENGIYLPPVNLDDSINTLQDEADPFIAPDESYLLIKSNRAEGDGVYISYKRKDGTWTKAINAGNEINGISPVNAAGVTPDGKYMFLFSNKFLFKSYSEERITYEEKFKILNSPGNGSIDIYWVDAGIIEDLRPAYLK